MATFNPNKNPAYVLLFAAVISAVFTAAIMTVYVVTEPTMQANSQLLVQRQVVDVFDLAGATAVDDLPGGRVQDLYKMRVMATDAAGYPVDLSGARLAVEGVDPPAATSPESYPHFYWAFAEDAQPGDAPVAVAVPYAGIGFWALVRGYVSIDLATMTSIDWIVLEHSETPGLGGRITEPEFKDQWRGLTMTPPAGGGKYVYVDRDSSTEVGSPAHGRHVDAITGATGTSRAVDGFVNEDLAREIPLALELAGRIRKDGFPRAAADVNVEVSHAGAE